MEWRAYRLSNLQLNDTAQLSRPCCNDRSIRPSYPPYHQRIMNYDVLEELAMGRVSDLVDQLVHHQQNGDEVMMAIVHQEIKDITSAMDSDDATDNFFYARDFRHLD